MLFSGAKRALLTSLSVRSKMITKSFSQHFFIVKQANPKGTFDKIIKFCDCSHKPQVSVISKRMMQIILQSEQAKLKICTHEIDKSVMQVILQSEQ